MPQSRLIRFGTCLTMLFTLTHCGSNSGSTPSTAGGGSSSSTGGTSITNSTGGATSSAGGTTTAAGGATSAVGGTTSAAGGVTGATGGSQPSGGSVATGGSKTSAGGSGGTGGSASTSSSKPTGGSSSTGGSAATGGSKTSAGGSGGTGGSVATGGSVVTGGSVATGGSSSVVDCKGQALAKSGDTATASGQYLNLGDMRLINNRWGSDYLNCGGTNMSVSIGSDKSLAWTFNRPDCDTAATNADPDYPEVEFGVAPFGTAKDGNGKPLLTTPDCSSTTLLPKQIKDITSASIVLTSYNINLQNPGCGCTTSGSVTTCDCSWNLNFEFWLSNNNPATTTDPGVYAEIIGFFGWQKNRWPCDKSGNVSSGGANYNLCHQSDSWHTGSPHWRYWQFNDGNSSQTSFNGTVDIKAFLSWLVSNGGVSQDLWLTRIEVGTEIDDTTQGSVKLNNVAFEINGTTKTPQFGQ